MSRTEPDKKEIEKLKQIISPFIAPVRHHLNSDITDVIRWDKREEMYGGDGVVYLLQMFGEEELVNNRIGAYMILPTSEDSCGYHTHGTRKEQELYVILNGHGCYYEKTDWDAEAKRYPLSKGSVTSVRGEAFHAVENTGDEPLIIFVITTNEPE